MIDPILQIIRIADKTGKYDSEAYIFTMESLQYTVLKFEIKGHLSGQQLLAGIKAFALARFGICARMVLEQWGLESSKDFGEIVFDLVNNKMLSKTENDNIDDFDDGFKFDELDEYINTLQISIPKCVTCKQNVF